MLITDASAPRFLRERDAAVRAATEAAGLIRRHAGRVAPERVQEKSLHDVVTEIDVKAQEIILNLLGDAFPDYGFLAEEEGGDAAGNGARWIVDPIDGTTNFTRGIPPYAVSIGLQWEGEMVAGVVLDVAHGELFTATRGGGLHVDGVPARCSRVNRLGDGILTTGFPYRSFDHIDAYLEVMRRAMQAARALRRPGAASVDLAWVACGRFDGFFEVGLMPWDVGAGLVLVAEGGGRVTDFSGHSGGLFGGRHLASNGLLHDALLALVGPLAAPSAR